jgi:hypothetical protein
MSNCEHRRIKKNYPFGRKSRADKFCLDCGEVVTNKMLEKRKENKRRP